VLLVALSILPFVALELWFYVKARRGLGPRGDRSEEQA
jgi:hypothetical protein